MNWSEIPGWFHWRSAQEEAVQRFPSGSRFVEVGNYLGRSLCSLGEVVQHSGKRIAVIGVDTCRAAASKVRQKDYHGAAVETARDVRWNAPQEHIECGWRSDFSDRGRLDYRLDVLSRSID
jgi:hypothetical protein